MRMPADGERPYTYRKITCSQQAKTAETIGTYRMESRSAGRFPHMAVAKRRKTMSINTYVVSSSLLRPDIPNSRQIMFMLAKFPCLAVVFL